MYNDYEQHVAWEAYRAAFDLFIAEFDRDSCLIAKPYAS